MPGDLAQHIGRRVRLRKLQDTIEGRVLGRSARVFASGKLGENASRLWVVQDDRGGLHHVHPDDDWVCELIE